MSKSIDAGASLPPRDFFVSYTQSDVAWARWIVETLEAAGRSACFQERDLKGNFVDGMREALEASTQVIGILSAAALASRYVQAEWNAAFNDGVRTRADRLVLFRIEPCEADRMLRQIAYVDLVDVPEDEARRRLLARVGIHPAAEPARFPGRSTGRAPYPAADGDSQRAAALRALMREWRLNWGARAEEIDQAAQRARDTGQARKPAQTKQVFALAMEVGQALGALPMDALDRARFHGLRVDVAVIDGGAMNRVASAVQRRFLFVDAYDWESAARVLESALALLHFDLDRLPKGYLRGLAQAPAGDLRGKQPLLLLRVEGEEGLRVCSASAPTVPLARLVSRRAGLDVRAARLDSNGRLEVIAADGEFVYAWTDSSALPTDEVTLPHAGAAAFLGAGPEAEVLIADRAGTLQRWRVGHSGTESLGISGVPVVGSDGSYCALQMAPRDGTCSCVFHDGRRVSAQPWDPPAFEGYSAELGPLWKSLCSASGERLAGLDAAMFVRHSAWGSAFFFADPATLLPLRPRLFVRNTHMAVLSATIVGGRWLVLTAVQGAEVAARLAVFDLESPRDRQEPALDLVEYGDLEAPVILEASRSGFVLVAALRELYRSARLFRYEWPARRVTELMAAQDLAVWGVA